MAKQIISAERRKKLIDRQAKIDKIFSSGIKTDAAKRFASELSALSFVSLSVTEKNSLPQLFKGTVVYSGNYAGRPAHRVGVRLLFSEEETVGHGSVIEIEGIPDHTGGWGYGSIDIGGPLVEYQNPCEPVWTQRQRDEWVARYPEQSKRYESVAGARITTTVHDMSAVYLNVSQVSAVTRSITGNTPAVPADANIATDSVLTDETGYFEILTPEAAKKLSQVTVEITRPGATWVKTYTNTMVDLLGGDLHYITLPDEFYPKGLLERAAINADISHDLTAAEKAAQTAEKAPGPVLRLGDGDGAYTLEWDEVKHDFSYQILHRLVEPQLAYISDRNDGGRVVTGEAGRRYVIQYDRKDIFMPLDVAELKKNLMESPQLVKRLSTLGLGYVLTVSQEWRHSHFSLGTLLYSMPLAPGEEQRIAVSDRSETIAVTDQEAADSYRRENYNSSQKDNVSAIYGSALADAASGNASMNGGSSGWSAAAGMSASGSSGFFSAGGSAVGGGGANETGASQSYSQRHGQDYASNVAQNFMQSIQRSAEAFSQASRIGIRLASASEGESVTTKIIANNNHSHALTMQYWEVLHNYKVASRINDVQLVLYVPMELISFLPHGTSLHITGEDLASDVSTQSKFVQRYNNILQYRDAIERALPAKYAEGLNILTKYAAYPKFEIESTGNAAGFDVVLEVTGTFMEFDQPDAYLRLKNGRRIRASGVSFSMAPRAIPKGYSAFAELETFVKNWRKGYRVNFSNMMEVFKSMVSACGIKLDRDDDSGDSDDSDKILDTYLTATFVFAIPDGVIDDDFQSLEFVNNVSPLTYTLVDKDDPIERTKEAQKSIGVGILTGGLSYLLPSGNSSSKSYSRTVTYSSARVRSLGALRVKKILLTRVDLKEPPIYVDFGEEIYVDRQFTFPVRDFIPTLSFEKLQRIEQMFRHVVENTLRYSSVVWLSLSSDERALLLEPYTIGTPMEEGDVGQRIPLMNCVQNEVLGIYGNALIMPFTFPPEAADALGVTNGALQSALADYHTITFRTPDSMVSLPTSGMVGEAVLSGSNSSEKIDLTRFWNWQDSPITHADSILPSSFSQQHLLDSNTSGPSELAGIAQNGFTLNAQSPTETPSLAAAIAQTPELADIQSLAELGSFANTLTTAGADERKNAVTQASAMTQSAMSMYGTLKSDSLKAGTDAKKADADVKKTEATANADVKKAQAAGSAGGGGSTGGSGGSETGALLEKAIALYIMHMLSKQDAAPPALPVSPESPEPPADNG
jgi:uncharacterized membrane protein YgcG